MSTNKEPRWARIIRLLPLLGVVAITLRLYWNLAKATDLAPQDEAFYLNAGSRFLHHGVLPPIPYSPLYAVWYAAHLAVFGNPIVTYYAQLYAVALLTAILMYVYLRQMAVPASLALLATTLWIAQPAYITFGWDVGLPRPYHFAFLLFLAGAVAIRRLKLDCPVPLLLAGASFLLLAVAARPEYLVALLFFVGFVAVSSRSRLLLPTEHRSYLWPVCLLVAAATLTTAIYLKGRAAAKSPYLVIDRFWFAFAQHFSFYQLGGMKGVGKVNIWYDWESIVGRTFPRAHSVLGAALANPRAFLGFELHNLDTLPRIIYPYLTVSPYASLKVSVLFLALMWLCFITLTGVSVRRRALSTSASALGPYVLSGAAAAIPGTLITPKIIYLLPLLFVLFVGAVKWLSVVLETEPAVYRSAAAVCAVLLSLAFVVFRGPFDNGNGAGKPMYLEAIQIRSILESRRVGGIRILQCGWGGYPAYLPYGLSEAVDDFDRGDNEPFWDFVGRAHIEAILVDDLMRSRRPFKEDSGFALFLASPDQFGWIAAPVGTRGDVFYLRGRRESSLR